MDGVRRTSVSGASPQALVLAPRKNRPAPLSQNLSTAQIGLDGMRRTPSPRDMIQMDEATPALIVPHVFPPQRSYARPMIGFSVVASALLVAGLTGSHLVTIRAADDATARVKAPATASSATPAQDEKDALALAQATKNASVQSILNSFVAAHGSQFTIFVKDLKTGTTASVNADRVMRSASLYKLFVAQRIYQLVDAGSLTYGQNAGSESGRTIEDCLTVMINISDNACGHDLGEKIGWSKQDTFLKNSGYADTTLGSSFDKPQMTNAKDVSLLMEHLYSGTLMSPNASDRFLNLLKSQRVNDRLPKGLPSGTVVAHKTGDLFGYTHDAGIIYGKNTDFLVVVMSGPWTSPEGAKPAIGELAGQLNNYFNQ